MADPGKGAFARNISSNIAGYLVSAVVALFLSPFVIGKLGDVRYGLWAMLMAVTGYYGLLDLGVRSAVGLYVTRYWAKEDTDGINRTLNTATILLGGVAALAMVLTIVLTLLIPSWITVEDTGAPALDGAALATLIDDVQTELLIAGGGIALGLPLALWSTVAYARKRFDISNAIGIGERLAVAAATVVALNNGGGLVSLAVVTVATQLLAAIVRVIVAFRLIPALRFRPSLASWKSVRELSRYGIYAFMVNAADKIVLYFDALIIGTFVTFAAVTYYDVGAKLIPYFMSLVLAVTWTMTPYATSFDARDDRPALRRLLLNGTRGSVFLTAVICAGILCAGHEFLLLWQDPKFARGDDYTSSTTVLHILAWATLVRGSTSCSRQILFGMRKMRTLAGLAFAEAALNLILSLVLVHYIGLTGVALGTLIPVVLLYLLVQNVLIARFLDVGLGTLAAVTLRATVPVMAAMVLVGYGIDEWFVADSWTLLGAKILLLLVPAVAIGWLVVMNTTEREKLWTRLFRGRNAG